VSAVGGWVGIEAFKVGGKTPQSETGVDVVVGRRERLYRRF